MTDHDGPRPARSKVGLALAGGVLEGGFYEVGVLCALQDAIEGLDFTRLEAYVGVSSGANVFAALRLARELEDAVVVTILCDGGAKYLHEDFWNESV